MKKILILLSAWLSFSCATQTVDKYKEIEKQVEDKIAIKMKEIEKDESIHCDFIDKIYATGSKPLNNIELIPQGKLTKHRPPIISGGKTYCGVMNVKHDQLGKFSVRIEERGVINGVKFRIQYPNLNANVGNGSIADGENWSISCEIDKMTDFKSCYATNYKASVTIYKSKSGYALNIGHNHYPGKEASIRINKNNPIIAKLPRGVYDFETSKKIVSKINNNDEVYVRFVKWPYTSDVTNKLNVDSFREVIKILDILYSKY